MQISVHKKAWMNEEGMFYLRTVCSEKKLSMQVTNTILGIFETRFERLYCCHGYHVTEPCALKDVQLYANFRVFAFLLKSFSVLKVSKSTILF